jgi:hypothetical protein
MEELGGNDLNELMSTKMCSPLMIYLVIIVVTSLSIYVTRSNLKRHNTHKIDNLFNLYSMQEIKLAIILGIILFGLCQYNKTTLAWIFLIFPVIYIVIQNLIVHIHVSSAYQTAPQEAQSHAYGLSGAKIVPQDSHVVQVQQTPEAPPVSTQQSRILPGSGQFGGAGSMQGFNMFN